MNFYKNIENAAHIPSDFKNFRFSMKYSKDSSQKTSVQSIQINSHFSNAYITYYYNVHVH